MRGGPRDAPLRGALYLSSFVDASILRSLLCVLCAGSLTARKPHRHEAYVFGDSSRCVCTLYSPINIHARAAFIRVHFQPEPLAPISSIKHLPHHPTTLTLKPSMVCCLVTQVFQGDAPPASPTPARCSFPHANRNRGILGSSGRCRIRTWTLGGVQG